MLQISSRFKGQRAAQTAKPRPPTKMRQLYTSFRPMYQYANGVRPALLANITIWRDTGEWVGFYQQVVTGPYGTHTEKYVWVWRGGMFHELRQFDVRDVQKRIFRG